MDQVVRGRSTAVLAAMAAMTLLLVLGAVTLVAALTTGSAQSGWHVLWIPACSVSVVLGWLVVRGAPRSPIGPALALVGSGSMAAFSLDAWHRVVEADASPLGLQPVTLVAPGSWVLFHLGFLLLVMVVPDGPLPGLGWRLLLLAAPTAAVLSVVAWAGTEHGASTPATPWQTVLAPAALGLLLVALLGGVVSLVLRYRRGDGRTRTQLRALIGCAALIPTLLVAGWVLWAAGVPFEPIGPYVQGAIVVTATVLVPAAVTLAILRYDLLDIDRLISGSVTWLATTVATATVFGLAAWVLATALPMPTGIGVAVAGFAAALLLLPLHQRLQRLIGRVLDPDRTVRLRDVQLFTEAVRDGRSEPEQVEAVLRRAVDDPGARLLLRVPGRDQVVDLTGAAAAPAPTAPDAPHAQDAKVALRIGDTEIGAIVLSRPTARRRRLAAEAALVARLPIEVTRLRLQVRSALADVTASRARLVTAVTEERRRLERDLHDGAQQRLVAVGMRLRSLQRGLEGEQHAQLDRAVTAIEETLVELRRLAHGVRPSRLDDGLGPALQALAADSPVAMSVTVGEVVEVDDARTTAAYLVAAEAVSNAWKHARAGYVTVAVDQVDDRLRVQVQDDGIGGVDVDGTLLTLRDRVASLGGTLQLSSAVGAGTTVTAVL